MATTLTLIETFKIDTRKSGDISYVKVCVLLDGIPTNCDFRARVGEEPVVIDGDTITVSDAQVEQRRAGRDWAAKEKAESDAREAARIADAWASLAARIDAIDTTDEARAEIRAVYEAHPGVVTDHFPGATEFFRFERAMKAVRARHGLTA